MPIDFERPDAGLPTIDVALIHEHAIGVARQHRKPDPVRPELNLRYARGALGEDDRLAGLNRAGQLERLVAFQHCFVALHHRAQHRRIADEGVGLRVDCRCGWTRQQPERSCQRRHRERSREVDAVQVREIARGEDEDDAREALQPAIRLSDPPSCPRMPTPPPQRRRASAPACSGSVVETATSTAGGGAGCRERSWRTRRASARRG